jgi:Glycosyl transferase family 90
LLLVRLFSDYSGCNHHNFGDESVPLLTSTAQVGCSNAFPIPSFALVTMSKVNVGDWYNEFEKSDYDYPFSHKLRKAVWRGSILDDDPFKVHESVQWKLAKLMHERNLDFFDVGIDEVPKHLQTIDLTPVGGLKPKLASRKQMQQYMAIIDLDGSSRDEMFASFLCYNSVVIKVDSAVVNYFHYDVKAWKHYIPVKADLSDLIENVVFALNPKNEPIIKDMISSANQFCAERFILNQLSHDVLDTLEKYVQLLDTYDASWKSQWVAKKDTISHSQLYNLVQLTE